MPKRKDYYKTLGVAKDAKPDDIKRAYRKKARAVHPDKENGNHEAMAELNNAFDVLSDPQRRLLYDSSGEDRQRPIDEEVRNVILQAFHEALMKGAELVLAHARQLIEGKQNQLKAQRSELTRKQKELSKRREKIKVKEGENLFHLLIDQQLGQIVAGIAQSDRGIEVMATALKILDAYESSEKETAKAGIVWTLEFATGSSTGPQW
jgi:curved DNA-binding protein CbpA